MSRLDAKVACHFVFDFFGIFITNNNDIGKSNQLSSFDAVIVMTQKI